MIDATGQQKFSFAEFEVDAARRRLVRNNETVTLNPKAFDLLLTLVENRNRILSKDELLETVWANQFVEENNLTVHISALRKALGEKKNENRFLVTVPGKGYKFVGDVRTVEDDDEKEIIIESRTVSRVVIEEETDEPQTEASEREHAKLKFDSSKRRTKTLPIAAGSIAALTVIAALFGYAFWRVEKKPDNRNLTLARLTTSGKVTSATITPDGKYAVFAQTENDGESLWLRHITTGSQQQILPTKPVRFVGLAIAPDGDSIYATTFSANVADPQIWRVPLLGGAVQEINGIITGAAISFAPDGKRMAFTESRSSMRETQLLVADADGANKKIVAHGLDDERSFPIFGASPVAWSPDGREIACAVEEKTNGGMKAGILLVNPGVGGERFISERRWDYIEHLAWTDAENLAFIAYTSEPWQGQIWTISRRTGEASQITNDLNNYAWLAGSANGNLLTVQKNAVSRVSIADFDERKNHLDAREIYKESGAIDNVAFASDGAVFYTSSANGKREIWRMNADGSNQTQLTVGANATFGLSVSPADGSIVFCSTEDGKHNLKLANRDGKSVRALTNGAEDVYPNFTADGQTVIYQKGLDNKLITLWRVSLADKIPVQLTQTHATHPTVSPDGAQTAFYFMDADADGLWRVGLISNADGSFAGKLSFPKAVTERRMRWHPNGKFIAQILYAGEDINLLLLPTAGGESSTVSGLGKGDVNWFEWSPDGRRIVVSHTTETQDVVYLSR